MSHESGISTFRHGIHPAEHKDQTAHLRSERMPFVRSYVLPLAQHTGQPSQPIVRAGERVRRGQIIAQPTGFVSTALHSPVTGTVAAIATRRHPSGRLQPAIVIDADPYSTQRLATEPPPDWRGMDRSTFIEHIQRAGIVGMGGAAFPTHVKLALPEGKTCRRLVVNGCECEPYLTCDHRVMVERPEAVVQGALILADKLHATEGVTIGVELNKHDAIAALRQAIPAGAAVEVVPLQVKYPQGAEKMLVHALFGLEVPAGKLPIDVGLVVNNVGTTAAIADYFETGQPLIERLITVAGPGVKRPANLLVPIGTPVHEVLAYCGVAESESEQVVMGGPMMGTPLASLDVPVLKGTSGLLVFPVTGDVSFAAEYQCIKCGRCLDACANVLNPSRLARMARAGRFDEMERYFVYDCMECGACSFACPSNIPIVQLIRVAKSELRKQAALAKKTP